MGAAAAGYAGGNAAAGGALPGTAAVGPPGRGSKDEGIAAGAAPAAGGVVNG
jgi:hypothetical protein